MDYLFIAWLALFITFVVFELATMGLTTIWFAGGSLVAFVLALCNVSWWIQLVAFVVISVLLLIITRPYAKKYINKNTEKTNVDGMIGKVCKVIEKIDNIDETGRIQIGGVEWIARTETNSEIIEPGNLVIIKSVEGVKLIVEKKEECVKDE